MRALHVTSLDGPEGVKVVDVPEPTPGEGDVVVEVRCVGISFPDLLLSRGDYQLKPATPFQLGVDFAGVVRSAPGLLGLRVRGPGRVRASLRRRSRGGRDRAGQRLPAAGQRVVRGRGRAADELPHGAVRARHPGRAARGRDGARARRRRWRRNGDDPGGQGLRRPRDRGGVQRGQGRGRPGAGADEVVLVEGFLRRSRS